MSVYVTVIPAASTRRVNTAIRLTAFVNNPES